MGNLPQQPLRARERHETVLPSPHHEDGLCHSFERLRIRGQDAAQRARHGAREFREVVRPQPLLEDMAADVALSMVTGYGGAPHEAPPTVAYTAAILASP